MEFPRISQLMSRTSSQIASVWQDISGDFPKGIALTTLYICMILLLRGCDALDLLWKGQLNELGDFFAGVFTPVAFGWLIYGYFLQHREFRLQREEFQATRKTLDTQVDVLKEQVAEERRQSEPHIDLQEGTIGRERQFNLRNFGRPVRDLTLIFADVDDKIMAKEKQPLLGTDQAYEFSIPNSSSSDTSNQVYNYSVTCLSERQEEWRLSWQIKFTGKILPAEIHLATRQRL